MSGASAASSNELLIEKVKGCELLYNTDLPGYKDPHVRQAAWEEIGRDINLKAEVVRYTWDKLRSCFLNAIRRRNIKRINGIIIKNPVWKYEKQMSFLLPFIGGGRRKPRKKVRENLEERDDDRIESVEELNTSDHSEQLLEGDEPNMKPEVTDVVKTDGSESSFTEITNAREREVNARCEDCELREKDETDMFFLSMAKTTKQLPVVEQAKNQVAFG